MTLIIPHVPPNMHPAKRMRRSATTVMAGHFDYRPYRPRDVLTSLLNGIGPYLVEDREEEERLNKRQQRREKEKQKLAKERAVRAAQVGNAVAGPSISAPVLPVAREQSHSYTSRPSIQINTLQRSLSVTPPPITALEPPSSPDSTPGPSNSSSTSRTSSKRPRTPEDYETIEMVFPTEPKPKKKRIAHRKGWKGWVEGSPPPSEKLINLDAVPILQERRTRSGKNFDAIGVGKDGWV
ncbi:hypothetical protein K435DRAFT_867161 [Dendrothele bispora CBS 962.96]|uniref:Uncharacterized protein n=1 Tax=Dendrothele bispora (strain CBS 962.96) TaxID=1314807 RepID=A0A4S8LFI9_DENBC|nr:hypothetical protein K435DRAFT_867161 [Dendrothele bispora CBS 962.96]